MTPDVTPAIYHSLSMDKLYNSVRYSGYSFMGGPQITARTGSVNAFAHALFGVEHFGGSVPIEDFRVDASINALSKCEN
jgi:hypothetical protein